jgi:archaellum component FlaC
MFNTNENDHEDPPDHSVFQQIRQQKNILNDLSNQWLQFETDKTNIQIAIYKAKDELKSKQQQLNTLNQRIEQITTLEEEINETENKLATTSQRIDDKITTLSSRVRQTQRQLLNNYKNDIHSLFIDLDLLITSQVKPMLDNIGHHHTQIPSICTICTREEGHTNNDNTFDFWTAIIPCGHKFCHECATRANQDLKCHLCNRVPDGILTLY